ncbi:MAG: tetratricopeptide repeat protein [Balneolaceae bacterium]|nr:tetratricopeptide repeat protein [Balneolaceae bacterium]
MYMLFLLLFSAISLSDNYTVEEPSSSITTAFEAQLNDGIDAFYRTDWVEARSIFKNMKEQWPDDPRPYFFESMMPFLEYFFVEQSGDLANDFLEKSEKAVKLSEQRLNSSPNDTTMVLMLSGLHGYRGLVAAGQSNHRIALSSGLTGFNYTRKLLSMDSARPDARIGRGMFYYMVGSIPSGMRWASNMVGLRADVDDGFNELKLAAESDSYIRNDALMMLMYLYHKEERFDDALYYAEELTSHLPDNVIFLYKKAEIHKELGNINDAINVYSSIERKNNPSLQSITENSQKKRIELEKNVIRVVND